MYLHKARFESSNVSPSHELTCVAMQSHAFDVSILGVTSVSHVGTYELEPGWYRLND